MKKAITVLLAASWLGGCAAARTAGVAPPPDAGRARGARDVAAPALDAEIRTLPRGGRRRLLQALEGEAGALRAGLPRDASAEQVLDALNARFFGPAGFAPDRDPSAPEGVSVAAVLERRRGTCVGLAVVYLSLARRLGLDARGVATPAHLYIRVGLGGRARNVELLEGGAELDDDVYRRRFKIDPSSVAAGVFLRDLTPAEVLAHLLSNQAVSLSRAGALDDALARYGAALSLDPRLAAAWYNRGIDLMNAGHLQEALEDFGRAIALHPADTQAHNNRGLVKARLGDTEGARADFLRALDLDPSLPEARQNLDRLGPPAGDDRPRP